MNRLFLTLTLSCLIANAATSDSPFAFGTNAVQNLVAKANVEGENEVMTSSIGHSLDDKVQGSTYAKGAGATDASIQLKADDYTDSNAVNVATEGGSNSENGFAVSNIKSELSLDNKAGFNTNPKYHKNFPGLASSKYHVPMRTYTLSTNITNGNNNNSATRGISSRRNKHTGQTSNRSQNNSENGQSLSSGLSLSNGNVNTGKAHSQVKANGSDNQVTVNDLAAANIRGVGAAVNVGSADANGDAPEASMRQQSDNIGFGNTETAGSAVADGKNANASGHIKSYYNAARTQAE